MCLDVCGLAANLYRRNTPVIKVVIQPTYMVYMRVHNSVISGR